MYSTPSTINKYNRMESKITYNYDQKARTPTFPENLINFTDLFNKN